MSDKVALYFGCKDEKGHFLHKPLINGRRGSKYTHFEGLPWDDLLDSGLLKNRKVPDTIDGSVHWTAGGKPDFWFAFFWWDRSVDSRYNSNSGFYVRGFGPAAEARANVQAAFEYACEVWPQVVERQAVPLHLIDHRAGRYGSEHA